MMVWTYPEKKYEKLGAERYEVGWEELRKSADGKEEIDFDSDLINRFAHFSAKDAAMAKAKEVAQASYFGRASVTRQIVDWFVEEDRVAEWVNTSDTEEVS